MTEDIRLITVFARPRDDRKSHYIIDLIRSKQLQTARKRFKAQAINLPHKPREPTMPSLQIVLVPRPENSGLLKVDFDRSRYHSESRCQKWQQPSYTGGISECYSLEKVVAVLLAERLGHRETACELLHALSGVIYTLRTPRRAEDKRQQGNKNILRLFGVHILNKKCLTTELFDSYQKDKVKFATIKKTGTDVAKTMKIDLGNKNVPEEELPDLIDKLASGPEILSRVNPPSLGGGNPQASIASGPDEKRPVLLGFEMVRRGPDEGKRKTHELLMDAGENADCRIMSELPIRLAETWHLGSVLEHHRGNPNVSFRILMLDPDTEHYILKSGQLENTKKFRPSRGRQVIEQMKEFNQDHPGKLKLRLAQHSFPYGLIDNGRTVRVEFRAPNIEQGQRLRIYTDSFADDSLASSFRAEFERQWSNAQAVNGFGGEPVPD